MGRRGPQPKPTKLRILEGNPSGRPLPENEPEPTAPLAVPDIIKSHKGSLEEWNRILAAMPEGFYSDIDAVVLAVCANAWTIWSQATRRLRKEGLTTEGSTGQTVAHPLLAVQRQQAEIILRCAGQLGMGPAARARLNAPAGMKPPKGKDGDGTSDEARRGRDDLLTG